MCSSVRIRVCEGLRRTERREWILTRPSVRQGRFGWIDPTFGSYLLWIIVYVCFPKVIMVVFLTKVMRQPRWKLASCILWAGTEAHRSLVPTVMMIKMPVREMLAR